MFESILAVVLLLFVDILLSSLCTIVFVSSWTFCVFLSLWYVSVIVWYLFIVVYHLFVVVSRGFVHVLHLCWVSVSVVIFNVFVLILHSCVIIWLTFQQDILTVTSYRATDNLDLFQVGLFSNPSVVKSTKKLNDFVSHTNNISILHHAVFTVHS